MSGPARQSKLEQLILAVFVGSAVGALALSHKSPVGWLFLAPCLLSLFWRFESLPHFLRVWTRYVAWAVLGGTVALGLLFMSYPVLSEKTAAVLTLVSGYSLAFFACLFLLGTHAWPAASTLIPVTLGTLVVAGFDPLARWDGFLALAGLAIFGHLVLGTKAWQADIHAGGGGRRRLLLLAFSGLGAFAIAWAIIRFLPWAQTRVEQAIARLAETEATSGYSSLSLHSRLGDLEQLKLSKKIVMRVWSSRPQKLRGRVFTEFDGQGWHARLLATTNLSPQPPDVSYGGSLNEWMSGIPGTVFAVPGHDPHEAAERSSIRTEVVLSVMNSGLMVSPGGILLIRAPLQYLRVDSYEGLTPPLSTEVEIYGIANRRVDDVTQAGPATQEMLDECLRVPVGTDKRLVELAARLARGSASVENRLRRTVEFVQNECHYSLVVGEFHSEQPVAEFLFEKKQGYCEYFASAAAVLLRLGRVPARYVTGFNVQEGNRQGQHFVVREADAHAWIEAYVPGKGWVEADPTPEAEYEALHADLRGGWFANGSEWLKAALEQLVIRIRQGEWESALRWLARQAKAFFSALLVENPARALLAVAMLLMLLAVRVRRRALDSARHAAAARPEAPDSTPPELKNVMSRLDELWARQGFLRPAFRAPLEHLRSIPAQEIPPPLREASQAVIDCYYRACFAGLAVDHGEVEALERLLDRTHGLRS